jgi:hypothetical protein
MSDPRLDAIRAVMPPRGTPHHEMPAYMQRDQQAVNDAHESLDALAAELERVKAALREKDGQPLLNAARRLVLATDNAERNAALGDLQNALDAGGARAAQEDA